MWKGYKGRAFKWDLTVTEVSSDMFGGFSVQYKCGQGSKAFIQDIEIKYPKEYKALVMQMQKGSTYGITGKLKRQSTLLGMSADHQP